MNQIVENIMALADEYMRWGEGRDRQALETAIEQALGQGEPVAWQFFDGGAWHNGDSKIKDHRKNTEAAGYRTRDLYTAPQPQPKQEPVAEYRGVTADGHYIIKPMGTLTAGMLFYKAPQPQPKQEPVYWEWRWFDESPYTVTSGQWSEWRRVETRSALQTLDDAVAEFKTYIANGYRYELRALYLAPQPQREWVNLTYEEIDDEWDKSANLDQYEFVRSCVAKLREKNGGGV
jgi:hypothetical protein